MSTNWVVIGCGRGIGLDIVRKLSADASVASIVGVCRTVSSDLRQCADSSAGKVKLITDVDMANEQHIKGLGAQVAENLGSGKKVGRLVHNAGMFSGRGSLSDNMDTDDWGSNMLQHFAVNTVAPMLVVRNFLQLNLFDTSSPTAGARVGFLTSRMGSIADNGSGGHYAYRMSKTALNMGAKNLSVELKDKNVAVGLLHPGLVATDMTADFGVTAGEGNCVSSETSASGLIAVMEEKVSLENTGGFWHAVTKEELPW